MLTPISHPCKDNLGERIFKSIVKDKTFSSLTVQPLHLGGNLHSPNLRCSFPFS